VALPQLFIDGDAGTTGLRIHELIRLRDDLQVLAIEPALRKDPAQRRAMLEAADIAILCLPDEAAREAASWVAGGSTRLIDASSAHRVAPGWVYGLPELAPDQRQQIAAAQRVSNPGCYPTAAVLALRPLIDAGYIASDTPLCVRGLSGYSGGGRTLIERWEDPERDLLALCYDAPYALHAVHKHVPELVLYAGLRREPQLVPSVGPFRCGMRVDIALHAGHLARGVSAKALWDALAERYAGEPLVHVAPLRELVDRDEWRFDPCAMNGTASLELALFAHASGHVWVMARLDNLGKGAACAALQCLNLMLGVPELRGLTAA
jgi:N-acetyl-gamma-glutamyl-phosphate reductase